MDNETGCHGTSADEPKWPTYMKEPYQYEKGMALVIALVFLLLLTILGVTAVSTNTLGEKMVANMKDHRVAFQNSESALRAGEAFLLTNAGIKIPTANDGLLLPPCTNTSATAPTVCALNTLGNLNDESTYPRSWWNDNGVDYGSLNYSPTNPRYVVEYQQYVTYSGNIGESYGEPGMAYYRLTAHATGATANARINVANYYAIPYNK